MLVAIAAAGVARCVHFVISSGRAIQGKPRFYRLFSKCLAGTSVSEQHLPRKEEILTVPVLYAANFSTHHFLFVLFYHSLQRSCSVPMLHFLDSNADGASEDPLRLAGIYNGVSGSLVGQVPYGYVTLHVLGAFRDRIVSFHTTLHFIR
jgi:hypothetical protein